MDTRTSTAPAACAGVLAVSVESFTILTFVASTPPNFTPTTVPVKPEPVIVTFAAPPVPPDEGEIDVMVGALIVTSPVVVREIPAVCAVTAMVYESGASALVVA
jgi:hypothetical protein